MEAEEPAGDDRDRVLLVVDARERRDVRVDVVRERLVADARQAEYDRVDLDVVRQRHPQHHCVEARHRRTQGVASDQDLLEPIGRKRALDGRENEVCSAALCVLEARVNLDVGRRLREERRVRVDLRELDVICDRQDLVRVCALVRDDDLLLVRVLRNEDCPSQQI